MVELAMNCFIDLKYGKLLKGIVPPVASYPGAHQTSNSRYKILSLLFKHYVPISADDVLVDVGCGRGRVLNWWLDQGLENSLIGLELNPQVAEEAQRRLRRHLNVTIISGDAISNLPAQGTVFYLYNPFDGQVLEKFSMALKEKVIHPEKIRIVYYNAANLQIFDTDPAFKIQRIAGVENERHDSAIITFAPQALKPRS